MGLLWPWGDLESAGDNSTVPNQLRSVRQVRATGGGAFAAILEDRSVFTWGDPDYGGDSSQVQDKLSGVQQVAAAFSAFAAILSDLSWHGALPFLVVIALMSKISSGACNRFTRQALRLLPSLQTALLSHGGIENSVVTALEFEISWGECSRSRLQVQHLLLSCQMDRSLRGAIRNMVVTALKFKFSWRKSSSLRPHIVHLLRSGQMDQSSSLRPKQPVDPLVWDFETLHCCRL